MSANHQTHDLVPYACLSCRCTFKRPFDRNMFYRKCPTCSEQAVFMDKRFRPPKKSDDLQWKKIYFLAKHGFYFQRVYRKEGGVWHNERYPSNIEQARDFVVQFKDQAVQPAVKKINGNQAA